MNDVKIDDNGDFSVNRVTGDLDLTAGIEMVNDKDVAATLSQIALIAINTPRGDFSLHPSLGNKLENMIGLPNKPKVAAIGEKEIRNALSQFGIKNKIEIDSWPEDQNTISYEIRIQIGSRPRMLTFTIQQFLDNSPEI